MAPYFDEHGFAFVPFFWPLWIIQNTTAVKIYIVLILVGSISYDYIEWVKIVIPTSAWQFYVYEK